MKLILLIVGLFVHYGTSAFISTSSKTALAKGKTLVYEYDTQIMNGIPRTAVQFSGIRMKSKVHIDLENDVGLPKIVLQMKNIEIRKINTRLDRDIPLYFLDWSVFQPLDQNQLLEEMLNMLSKPIKFVWNNGKIGKMEAIDVDSSWSVNIKKGLVELLQNDLRKLDDQNRPSLEITNSFITRRMESGVAGTCETTYNVRPTGDKLEVDKTKNYKRCDRFANDQPVPAWWNIPAFTFCASCKFYKKDLIEITHRTNQILDLSETTTEADKRAMPLIRQVNSISTFTVTPFNTLMHGAVQTVALQRLVYLTSQNKTSGDKVEDSDKNTFEEIKEHLRLLVSDERIDKESLVYKSYIAEINKLSKRAMDNVDILEYRVEDMLKELMNVVQYLRKLKEDDLFDWVYTKNAFSDLKSDPKKRLELIRHVPEILPALGNENSIKVITRLVEQVMNGMTDDLTTLLRSDVMKTTQMLRMIALTPRISKASLQSLLNLVKSDKYREVFLKPNTDQIYEAGWLAVGAMANTLFVQTLDSKPLWEEKITENMEMYKEFRKDFVKEVQKLVQSKNPVHIYLGIKVIGNTGMFDFKDTLKDIVLQMRDVAIQREAIHAFSKIIKFRQSSTTDITRDVMHRRKLINEFNQIVEFLMEVFGNEINFDVEVRLTAYKVLIMGQPKKDLLSLIFEQAMNQNNEQLRRYVFTHLIQMNWRKGACSWPIKWDIRSLLASVRPLLEREIPLNYWRVYELNFWCKYLQMGLSVGNDLIFGEDDAVWRSYEHRIDVHMFGRTFPLIEFGVSGGKLLGQQQNRFLSKSEFWEKLKIMVSSSLLDREGPDFLIYINILDNCLGFINISPKNMGQSLKTLQSKLLQLGLTSTELDRQMAFVLDLGVQHPTSNGFFFYAQFSFLSALRIKGQVKKLDVNLHNTMILHSGMYSTPLSSCVHVRKDMHLIPASIETQFSMPEPRNLKFKWRLLNQESVFLKLRHHVTTHVIEKLILGDKGIKKTLHTLPVTPTSESKSTTTVIEHSILQTLGFKVNAKWEYDTKEWLQDMPTFDVLGKFSAHFTAVPIYFDGDNQWMTFDLKWNPPGQKAAKPSSSSNLIRMELRDPKNVITTEAMIDMITESKNSFKFRLTVNNLVANQEFKMNTDMQIQLPTMLEFPKAFRRLPQDLSLLVDNERNFRLSMKVALNSEDVFDSKILARSLLFNLPANEILEYVNTMLPTLYKHCDEEIRLSGETQDRLNTPMCKVLQEELNQLFDIIGTHETSNSFFVRFIWNLRRLVTSSFIQPWFPVPESKSPFVSTENLPNSKENISTNQYVWRTRLCERSPRRMDLILKFPTSGVEYMTTPHFWPIKDFLQGDYQQRNRLPGTFTSCYKQNNFIRTFDDKVKVLKTSDISDNCKTVLAFDCKNKLFKVTSESSPDRKKLSISFMDINIEVFSTGTWPLRVNINGQEVEQTATQVILPENLKEFMQFTINSRDKLYTLRIMQLMYFQIGEENLNFVRISPTFLYRGDICGTCTNKIKLADKYTNRNLKNYQSNIETISCLVPSNKGMNTLVSKQSIKEKQYISKNKCELVVKSDNSVSIKTFTGLFVRDIISDKLKVSIRNVPCPLVLFKSKEVKVLLNRHLDLIIERANEKDITILAPEDGRLKVLIGDQLFNGETVIFKQGEIVFKPKEVKVVFNKNNMVIRRTLNNIFLDTVETTDYTGICKDLTHEESNNVYLFSKKYFDHSVSHCSTLQNKLTQCSIKQNSLQPFGFIPRKSYEVFYLNTQLKNQFFNFKCPLVLVSVKKPYQFVVKHTPVDRDTSEVTMVVDNVLLSVKIRNNEVIFEPIKKTTNSGVSFKLQRESTRAILRTSNGFIVSILPEEIQINLPSDIDYSSVQGLCSTDITEKFHQNPYAVFDWTILNQIDFKNVLSSNEINQCLALHMTTNSDEPSKNREFGTCLLWTLRNQEESKIIPLSTAKTFSVYDSTIGEIMSQLNCPIKLATLMVSGRKVEIAFRRTESKTMVLINSNEKIRLELDKSNEEISVFVNDKLLKDELIKVSSGTIEQNSQMVQYRTLDDAVLKIGRTNMIDLVTINIKNGDESGICHADLELASPKNYLHKYLSFWADPKCKNYLN